MAKLDGRLPLRKHGGKTSEEKKAEGNSTDSVHLMINHILSNPLDPWSWIAILFLLFTVVLPLLVIIAVSILVILLFRKKKQGLEVGRFKSKAFI